MLLIRPASLRSRLPVGDTARGFATWALFVVLAQESLERSLRSAIPAVAAMTPSGWLVLVAGLAATALVLALALRAGQAVYAFLAGVRVRRSPLLVGNTVVAVVLPNARPLAGNVALRAPPALAR